MSSNFSASVVGSVGRFATFALVAVLRKSMLVELILQISQGGLSGRLSSGSSLQPDAHWRAVHQSATIRSCTDCASKQPGSAEPGSGHGFLANGHAEVSSFGSRFGDPHRCQELTLLPSGSPLYFGGLMTATLQAISLAVRSVSSISSMMPITRIYGAGVGTVRAYSGTRPGTSSA